MGRWNATNPVPQPAPDPEPPTPTPKLVVLPPPGQRPAETGGTPVPPKPKLNFGGIKKKDTAAAPASEYPVLPDPDGTQAEWAAAFLDAQAREEAAKGAKETARLELIKVARPFHFKYNSGHLEVPSSVTVASPRGEVRVTFKDAYKKLDETKFSVVQEIIGQELANTYLTQTFEFSIKSNAIPEAKMQAVIDAVTEMAGKLGIEDAVAVATCYKPTSEWHSARFRHLTAEQNLELETAIDSEKGFCTVAVGPVRGKK